MDSALVSASFGCSSLYCFTKVQTSGTMAMQPAPGQRTNDLSPPTRGLGTIITAYTNVVLADSLVGKAVVDESGLWTVFVGAKMDPSGFTPTDCFTLQGTIGNGRLGGRRTQQIDPHGLAIFGSFTTARSRAIVRIMRIL
jgi:hypothetical protein